jgi:hypothetical protein
LLSIDRAEELSCRLFLPWQRAVRRTGADALEERGVDVQVCDLGDMSSGVLGAYLSKIGHEVAGSHNKAGRATESFTIVGLLREVIETYEVAAFRAWQELERTIAGKRRKFLTWSDGAQELRARAGHGRRDKSDEELAEEDDLASADLLAVDREDWPRLVAHLEQLYRVGGSYGLAAARVWLTEHGIAWRELVQPPRRPRQQRPPQRAPRPPRFRASATRRRCNATPTAS